VRADTLGLFAVSGSDALTPVLALQIRARVPDSFGELVTSLDESREAQLIDSDQQQDKKQRDEKKEEAEGDGWTRFPIVVCFHVNQST
jgi:hypothetical protein